jgi:hypothetical protein
VLLCVYSVAWPRCLVEEGEARGFGSRALRVAVAGGALRTLLRAVP